MRLWEETRMSPGLLAWASGAWGGGHSQRWARARNTGDKATETTWLPVKGSVEKQASPQELGVRCEELWGCTAGESLPWCMGGWKGPCSDR